MTKPIVAIVGAGPAGLAAAEILSTYNLYDIRIYEQKPSAARKFLMAGKTGLNISHNEPFAQFIQRYDQIEWLTPIVRAFQANDIQSWMQDLGVESYVGSSGRIFPNEMKAAPLLRAWLKRLQAQGVSFFYRHQCVDLNNRQLQFKHLTETFEVHADAIVLACGAKSWPQLGSDGAWLNWLDVQDIHPFVASNVGVKVAWSSFMTEIFGQPLKRIKAWVGEHPAQFGEMVISHYGLEGGLVYRCNRDLRTAMGDAQSSVLSLDLLPDLTLDQIQQKLVATKKQSLNTLWQRAGLDKTKIALLRDVVPKQDWNHAKQMAKHIKSLKLTTLGFQPIEQAISCAGGVRLDALDEHLQLHQQQGVFVCGEMVDWDAPTGGYLLTACLAMGRKVGQGIHQVMQNKKAD